MNSWVLYAFLSALFASLVAIFGKLGISKLDTTLATTLRAWILALFLTALTFFLNKFSSKGLDEKALIYIALSGIAGGLSMLFYFIALKNGPTASVAALDRMSLVFVLILSAVILGESVSIRTVSAIILMSLGAFLLIQR